MKELNGIDKETGLFTSRYYANKAKSGDEIAVKVCGGYRLMTYNDYNIWKKQK